MLLNCGAGEDSWESLGVQGNQTSQTYRKSTLNILWKDWCWSSNTLVTWCEKSQLIGKDPGSGKDWGQEEKGDRGWDGWMASLTQWIWVWANSGRLWRTGKPGVLPATGLQRVRHNLVTEQQQQMVRRVPGIGWVPRKAPGDQLCSWRNIGNDGGSEKRLCGTNKKAHQQLPNKILAYLI